MFQRILNETRQLLYTGNLDVATVLAEIAANVAMSHHSGIFASSHLERILREIGRTLPSSSRRQPKLSVRSGGRHHVIHLLTTAANVGGDARFVWRWIEQDTTRVHSLVLTRQGALPIPDRLRDAVTANGGNITVLNQHRGSLRRWASMLRSIAISADAVVVHTHPYDVIPVIALAGINDAPPVIYVDHADHAFWVGASVVNVVASLRETGARVARERRGFAPGQIAPLPTILNPPDRDFSRRQAKVMLGLDPDTTLLLSIARPHKYVALDDQHFLNDMLPIVTSNPNTELLVIGPDDTGEWEMASRCTNGRIRALGQRHDTALYYQAADIYVDSFPIVSITSLLEAGGYGLPLVSRCISAEDPGILGADAPGLTPHLIRTTGVVELQNALTSLIDDPIAREHIGEQTRLEIRRVHTGYGWQQSLEEVYARAATTPARAELPLHVDECQMRRVDMTLPRVFATEPTVTEIVRFHLRLLPPRARLQLWLRLLIRQQPAYPGLLLPEWLGVQLERW